MDKSKSDKSNKANMQTQIKTQNVDTGLSVFKTDDIRPYEQKNMPQGTFNKKRGGK
ncbi:MAG: hypothetical protein FWD99_01950 [Oscillospiraceae bacterium]|nr:hypothetical protein [Oscillospiraceae bacterium]